MKSYMDRIAEMLGVKMGEHFIIKCSADKNYACGNEFCIVSDGIHCCNSVLTDTDETALEGLLIGRYTVEKIINYPVVCGVKIKTAEYAQHVLNEAMGAVKWFGGDPT